MLFINDCILPHVSSDIFESPALLDEREGKQVSKLDGEKLNRFLSWKIKRIFYLSIYDEKEEGVVIKF